jgi:hypothetical protein
MKETLSGALRHVAYAGGWKKLEPLWDGISRMRRATQMLPALEAVLSDFGKRIAASEHDYESVVPEAI